MYVRILTALHTFSYHVWHHYQSEGRHCRSCRTVFNWNYACMLPVLLHHKHPAYTYTHNQHKHTHTHTHVAHTYTVTHSHTCSTYTLSHTHTHNTHTTHAHNTYTIPTLPVNAMPLPRHPPIKVNSVLDSLVTTTTDLQTEPLDPTQPVLTYTTVRDLW